MTKRWIYFDNERLAQLIVRAKKLGANVVHTSEGWTLDMPRAPVERTVYSLLKELCEW